MRLDHLIYAHPDLDEAVDEVERLLGVRAAGGGQHPGRGTHNRLLALGPKSYLELIAPDPHQPEPAGPRPYGVEGITAGRLVGWVLAADDIDSAAARARSRGLDLGAIVEGERRTPNGETVRWRATANGFAAGPVPFLISWGESRHPADDAPRGLELVSLRVDHPEPDAIARTLEALDADLDIGVEVRRAPSVALVALIRGPRGEVELR